MYSIKKIDNGITLITHQLCHLHSVTIGVGFRIGSLYENDNNRGITHLLEHLHFRHLYDLSQNELYFKMQVLGAEILGKTYHDLLSFEITVVSEYFTQAFDLMLRHFLETSWTSEEFNKELSVVIKQIENKSQSYNEWLDENYFDDTAYSQSIMGDVETLERINIQDVLKWQKTYLTPANSCVVITGCADNDMLYYAKSKLESLPKVGVVCEPVICFPKNFAHRSLKRDCKVISCDEEESDITLFFDVPPILDYEAVRVLSSVLGEGCGSKLGIELREKSAFTDEVYTELFSFCGFNRLSVSFSVNNSDFSECLKTAIQSIGSLKNSVSEMEFLSSITFFTKNQLIDLDDPVALNRNYLFSYFVLNSKVSAPLYRKAKYENIDKVILSETAKALFVPTNLSFLIETSIPQKNVMCVLEKLIALLM
ncbi:MULTISPECIES: pitrilysin family protein [unclassified Ruminococcus]|uniref:M16 family metallopeptidase n=1 Tax=unclassified Ruminococcus TaxID=2608920 RepID=UPI0021086785|nr:MULTISPECIES: pitrilysin family protein [unclassified Ruminococcus]MCQ4021694.1 hypothetical protein [Ruminococcus sp. zg-924]MCQ4114139.1 hypothetical protein [Ruminococcus sp. zg-921]